MPVHFPWKMGGWWDLGQLLPCLWHCLSAWCICIISATVHHHKSGTAFPSKFQGKIALLGLCPPGQPAPRHLAALACLAPGAVSVGDSREGGWTLVLDLTSWMSICIFRSRSQLVGCLRPPHSLFKGPSAAGGRVPGYRSREPPAGGTPSAPSTGGCAGWGRLGGNCRLQGGHAAPCAAVPPRSTPAAQEGCLRLWRRRTALLF